ncbi:MAG: DUF928 domain-containing protein [Leptolyngbyaceae bacterium]|nr:DUF928 domain-containing protein [Leptolyngbyaceae bacterium]
MNMAFNHIFVHLFVKLLVLLALLTPNAVVVQQASSRDGSGIELNEKRTALSRTAPSLQGRSDYPLNFNSNSNKIWNPFGWLFGGSREADSPVDRRRGGASRDQCPAYGDRSAYTAIVPFDDIDLSKRYTKTASASPNFWFYVPFTPGFPEQIEFILINEDEETIYQNKFTVTDTPGIVRIQIPEDQVELEENRLYHWVFSAICDLENRSGDITIDGWVKRVELDSNLEVFQDSNLSLEAFSAFSDEKLWHETLTTIIFLKEAEPDNAQVQSQWNEMLVGIQLGDLVDAPISNCCSIEAR